MSRRRRASTVAAAGCALVVTLAVPYVSASEVAHPQVVSEDPANVTPRLVPFGSELRPYANAIAELGETMYAGGRFLRVFDDRNDVNVDVKNFVIFDEETHAVSPNNPAFAGDVWAIEPYADDGSVFVGGEFTNVNGASNTDRLVKLNADGTVNTAFNASLSNGRVLDLHMYEGPAGDMLFVGGSSGQRLMALDPLTGANTGYIDLGIEDEIVRDDGVTALGDVSVNNFAISPDQTKLVAVGNFRTVAGQSRQRAFMADLPPLPAPAGQATLSEWYYAELEPFCRNQNPRRMAYLSDVDFSPDSSYFVIVATGFLTKAGDAGKTLCDSAARFETPVLPEDMHPSEPTWINYTGGDTIWSVVVTGAAVYVQGHFKYLNAEGDLEGIGPNGVSRLGVGAIDPDNPDVDPNGGKALPWAPAKPARQGGKQLLATPEGLWVVSDSQRFEGEPRYGIAFAPLPPS